MPFFFFWYFFLYDLSLDQIQRSDNLHNVWHYLPALPLQKYLISPCPPPVLYQSCFLPFPLLYSVHLACRWSYYLSLEADGAEKWRDRSFNLAYLSQHTFSLSSSSVPSNSSKLQSKLLLLSCCPLCLKSEHSRIYELSFSDESEATKLTSIYQFSYRSLMRPA